MYALRKRFLLGFVFVLLLQVSAQDESIRMFHIERNKNSSIVCYDLEVNDNTINKKNPIHAYWEMPEKNNARNSLSPLQNKLAYGYTVDEVGENKLSFKLKAYPARALDVVYEPGTQQAQAYVYINGVYAVLDKLYIKASPPFYNSVEYIMLSGINPQTGEVLVERIYNT